MDDHHGEFENGLDRPKKVRKHKVPASVGDSEAKQIKVDLKKDIRSSKDLPSFESIAIAGKRLKKKGVVAVGTEGAAIEVEQANQQPEIIEEPVQVLKRKNKKDVLKPANSPAVKPVSYVKPVKGKKEVEEKKAIPNGVSILANENCLSSQQIKKLKKKDTPSTNLSSAPEELKQEKPKKIKKAKNHDLCAIGEAESETADDRISSHLMKTEVGDKIKSKKKINRQKPEKKYELRQIDDEYSSEAFTDVGDKRKKLVKPSKVCTEFGTKEKTKSNPVSSVGDSKIEIDTVSKLKVSKVKILGAKSAAKCVDSCQSSSNLFETHNGALCVAVQLDKALKRKARVIHSKDLSSKSELDSPNCLQPDSETSKVKPAKIRKKNESSGEKRNGTVVCEMTSVNNKKKRKDQKIEESIETEYASGHLDIKCSTFVDEPDRCDSTGAPIDEFINPPNVSKKDKKNVISEPDISSKSKKSKKTAALDSVNTRTDEKNQSICDEIETAAKVEKKSRKHKVVGNSSEASNDATVISGIKSNLAVIAGKSLPVVEKPSKRRAVMSVDTVDMGLALGAGVKAHKKSKKSLKLEVNDAGDDSLTVCKMDVKANAKSSETLAVTNGDLPTAQKGVKRRGLLGDRKLTSPISCAEKKPTKKIEKKSRKQKVGDCCSEALTSASVNTETQSKSHETVFSVAEKSVQSQDAVSNETSLSNSDESKAHKKKHKSHSIEADAVSSDSLTVSSLDKRVQSKSSETPVFSEGLSEPEKPLKCHDLVKDHGKSTSSLLCNNDDRVSSSSVDAATPNLDNGYLGQWATASFDSSERMPKFVRLLGGLKNRTDKIDPTNQSTRLKSLRTMSASTAMSATEEKQFNQSLESQYDKALELKLNQNKRVGLGFEPPPETGKKNFIDKSLVRSKTFDDDD